MINTKTSNKNTNTNNTKIAGAMTTKNTAYIPPRNTDINGDLSDKIIITTKDSHTPAQLNGGKNNPNITVVGRMSEDFSYSLSNDWSARENKNELFGTILRVADGGLTDIMNFFGKDRSAANLSGQTSIMRQNFQGQEYAEFDVSMDFIIESDPQLDLLNPIKNLNRIMVAPKTTGFIGSPHPVDVQIGKIFKFPNMAIRTLNFTTSGRVVYKEKIYPAKVTANLSLVATTLWVQEEVMDIFLI